MVKKIKKGTTGNAAQYLTRNQALKKLQLKLSQFRRLCILKGIHPREPKKKPAGQHKTYYHVKDVNYLLHEPVLKALREQHAYQKKLRKARARRNHELLQRLRTREPGYRLDHLVRERYPSFVDAVRDMDDPLTLTHLFAVLPAEQRYEIPAGVVSTSRRLALEFQAWAVRTHALRKVFVSVKGYYFQAEVMGQPVTWLVPHATSQVLPPDVDYRVLLTFLEFYHTLLGFVNYKLYHGLGLRYPPVLDPRLEAAAAGLEAVMRDLAGDKAAAADADADGSQQQQQQQQRRRRRQQAAAGRLADVSATLRRLQREDEGEDEGDDAEEEAGSDDEAAGSSGSDGEEGEEEEEAGGAIVAAAPRDGGGGGAAALVDPDDDAAMCEHLFNGLVFFLGREVPREQLMFVIRAFGGEVGWEGDGSPFGADSDEITHQVVDRPKLLAERRPGREYVQPQWVFDSANFRVHVPVDLYAPGAKPPPHLSPFVDADEEGYTPEYGQQLQQLREADAAARRRALGIGEDAAAANGGGHFVGDAGDGPAGAAGRGAGTAADVAAAEQQYAADLSREINEAEGLTAGSDDDEQQQKGSKKKKQLQQQKKKADIGEQQLDEEDEDAAAEKMAAGLLSRKKRRLLESVQHKENIKRTRVERLQRKRDALAARARK